MFSLNKLKYVKSQIKIIDKKINTLAMSPGDMIEVTDKMFGLIEQKRQFIQDIHSMKVIYRTLPEKTKKIVWLRHKGFEQKNIAKVLHLNVATVSKCLKRYEKGVTKSNETTRE